MQSEGNDAHSKCPIRRISFFLEDIRNHTVELWAGTLQASFLDSWPEVEKKHQVHFVDCVCWGVCVTLWTCVFVEVSNCLNVLIHCSGLHRRAFTTQASVSPAAFFHATQTSFTMSHSAVPDMHLKSSRIFFFWPFIPIRPTTMYNVNIISRGCHAFPGTVWLHLGWSRWAAPFLQLQVSWDVLVV